MLVFSTVAILGALLLGKLFFFFLKWILHYKTIDVKYVLSGTPDWTRTLLKWKSNATTSSRNTVSSLPYRANAEWTFDWKLANGCGAGLLTWTPSGDTYGDLERQVGTRGLLHSEGSHRKAAVKALRPFRSVKLRDPKSKGAHSSSEMWPSPLVWHWLQGEVSPVWGTLRVLHPVLPLTPGTHAHAHKHIHTRALIIWKSVGLCHKKHLCSERDTRGLEKLTSSTWWGTDLTNQGSSPTPFSLCHVT